MLAEQSLLFVDTNMLRVSDKVLNEVVECIHSGQTVAFGHDFQPNIADRQKLNELRVSLHMIMSRANSICGLAKLSHQPITEWSYNVHTCRI